MAPASADLRLCLLGPTTVERSGRAVPIGGRLPRRLLTALAAGGGAPVPVDTLRDLMWDGDPPPHASASVHAYISRLRRALGCAGGEGLTLYDDRYALRLHTGCRDTDELDRLVQLTQTAAPAAVIRLGDRALELCRGTPYADAGPRADPLVAPARAHCEEEMLTLVERRLAALLDLGQVDRAIGELREQVASHPFRERGWQLLIIALYRAGRQAEALAECRALRVQLDTELGILPGPALQVLETAVLRQDPRLLWDRHDALLEPQDGPTPARSPLPTSHGRFVGRGVELAQLDALAADHDLVTVHGPGGVGKTRLAVEWARRRAGAGDPVWFAGLKAETRADAVAATIARAVGARSAIGDPVRSVCGLLAGRVGVLLLDNAEHVLPEVVAMVEALRGVATGVTVVVTTRTTLGLAGEAVLPLAPLPLSDGPGSAVELLRERIAAQRPGWMPDDSDRQELGRLARVLDGLPLALELAAARTRAQSLADLAGSIDVVMAAEVPRGSVNGHDTLAAAIDWSLGLLSDAQRGLVLRLWPFVAGFTADAVDEAFGTDSLPMLADLVAKSVIIADTRSCPTRFWLLETVRARCRQLDPDPEASRLGLARWVRATAWRTDAQMCDQRSATATRRLRAELPNIEAAFRFDLERSAEDALRTVTELNCWWIRTGQGMTALRWLDTALAQAPDAPPGLAAKAHLLRAIALVFTGGRAEQILAEADVVQRLIEPIPVGDPDGDHVLGELPYLRSLTSALRGDFVAGRRYAEECERVVDRLGTTWLLATVNTTLAAHDMAAGDISAAFARIEVALRLSHRIGMRWGLATAGRVLATIYLEAGRPAEALAAVQVALRHALDDDDSINGLSNGVVAARALAAVGDAWTAAVVADGVRDWARRAQSRWDSAEAGTLGDLDLVLDRALDAAERSNARRIGAQSTIEELLEQAAMPRPDLAPDWRDGDVRVPLSL